MIIYIFKIRLHNQKLIIKESSKNRRLEYFYLNKGNN